ncbi:MAG: hypothetical protein HFJ51_07150 [Clostridia bacterium]|nr:hypothetical protein [Clostridia bacterium]
MGYFIMIASIVMMFLLCLALNQINRLEHQKTMLIRKIMRGEGTIVYKYDKINETLFQQK